MLRIVQRDRSVGDRMDDDGREHAAYVRTNDRNRRELPPAHAPMTLTATTPPGASRSRTTSRNSRVVRWNGTESA